jgi:hypothetical protein
MFKIIQRFRKHCSCHPQGEYMMVGHFWKTYIGQAVGGELDLVALISDWISARSSAPNTQLLHIHPRYSNCNIC